MAVSSTSTLFFVVIFSISCLLVNSTSIEFKNYKTIGGNQVQQFYTEKIRCWRYCLQNAKNTEKEASSKFLNLTWEFEKSLNRAGNETILIPKMSMERLQNINKMHLSEETCENLLVLGCKVPETNGSNFVQQNELVKSNVKTILIQREELDGYTETKFSIKNVIPEMYINVLGNLSKINLQLPVEWAEANRILDMMLSATRVRDSMTLQLNIRNPPEGEWCLKLSGVENSKYRLIVSTFEEKIVDRVESHVDNRNTGNVRTKRVLAENTDMSKGQIRFEDENDPDEEFENALESEEKMRESEIVESFDNWNATFRFGSDETKRSESLEFNEFDRNYDGLPRRKYIMVDVKSTTKLVFEPNVNVDQPVAFEVFNDYPFNVLLYFSATSSEFRISPFRQNNYVVPSGQRITVTLNVRVPYATTFNSGTVMLKVFANNPVSVIAQKSVYIFIQNTASRLTDDSKPTLRYYFNNNCAFFARMSSEYCSKIWWSVDVEAEDLQSGLKVVTSSPHGLYPRMDYISGSKSLQKFYYTASCCNPIVEIEAVDLLDNRRPVTIDVRAWDNLTYGEIAAIVLAVLCIILLIILIAVCIMYCLHKRKSLDLPYSQRYGSRPSQRNEATNF